MKETLYIYNDYYIGKSNDTIQCSLYKDEKKETKTVPIERIKDLIICGNINISIPLLTLCNQHSIPIYFCNYFGSPIGMFFPKKEFSPTLRIKQYACYLDKAKRNHIAKAIITKSLQNRIHVIKKFDKEKNVSDYIENIEKYIAKLDEDQTTTELMSYEANAMKNYYKAFSMNLKHLDFGGKRTRQPPESNANALMSFGNMMVYNKVSTQIYLCGLDDTIGFLHEIQNNRNTLTLDISEIFKPILVDDVILKVDRQQHINEKHFESVHENGIYLNTEGKDIWTQKFKSTLDITIPYNPLRRRISVEEEITLECYNLIKYIIGEKDEYVPIQFYQR